MPCLIILVALAIPRVVIILLWLFSNWFDGVFRTPIGPILGFLFLPTTMLWYSAVQHWWGGVWGIGAIIGLVIAFFIDISPHRAGWWRRRI